MRNRFKPGASSTWIILTFAISLLLWLFNHFFLAKTVQLFLESNGKIVSYVFKNRKLNSLEHYISLFRPIFEGFQLAVLLGGLLSSFVFSQAFRRRFAWQYGAECNDDNRRLKALQWIIVLFLNSSLIVTVLVGKKFDYLGYLGHWQAVISGMDPWGVHSPEIYGYNAYGPLFNLMAPLAVFNTYAPRLLFVLALIFSLAVLLFRYAKTRCVSLSDHSALWLLVPLPFLVGVEVIQGNFDILPAIAAVLAIKFTKDNKGIVAGFFLSVAVLLKIYPLVLLPFLTIGERRFRLAPALSTILFTVAGLGASVAVWGWSTFNPILFAHGRSSAMMSIFYFLRNDFPPFSWIWPHIDIDRFSTVLMLISCTSVLFVSLLKRIDLTISCFLGMLTALTFYKVGYHWYQVIVVFIALYWYVFEYRMGRVNQRVWMAMVIYMAWLSVVEIVFLSLPSNWEIAQQTFFFRFCGLPHFLISLLTMALILTSSFPSNQTEGDI